jgi:hypothetical protein
MKKIQEPKPKQIPKPIPLRETYTDIDTEMHRQTET